MRRIPDDLLKLERFFVAMEHLIVYAFNIRKRSMAQDDVVTAKCPRTGLTKVGCIYCEMQVL